MPSPSATLSTLQVGTYNPTLDTWTQVLDLNDRTNFYVRIGGMKLDQPEKAYTTSFTMRAPGERQLRRQYKNRHILASIWIRGSTTTAILTNVRNLLAAIEQPPYRLKVALPGASGFSYADCIKVTHNIPSDAQEINAGAINHVEIDFECFPGLYADQASGGTRLTLSNLLMNAGFEAPASPGIGSTQVFGDFLLNTGAYTVQAGGALGTDTFRYPDTILVDTPIRYERFGEASGSVAADVTGNANGSYGNSPTLGVTGALTGDADTAVTLASASSQRVTVGTTNGLPTGNAAISVVVWLKIAAAPGANQYVWSYGNTTPTSGQMIECWVDSTAKINVGFGGAALITSAAISTAAYHMISITWDGTTLKLKIDNGAQSTATPSANAIPSSSTAFFWGARTNGSSFLSGTLDEGAIFTTAVSNTRLNAYYTAATNSPTTVSTSMTIPNGGRVSFGSPAWSAINTWQIRFRWITSLTATFYLHYTDANNNLAVTVTGAQLALKHTVASTVNTLGTASITLANGAPYWLQITQFPNINTSPMPQAKVILSADTGGASTNPGTTVASIAATALSSNSVAISGAPQIAASGAALGLGGSFNTYMHTVALFGPGGWSFAGTAGSTSPASGAWDQNTNNTYPNGPVTSFGAARIDIPPGANWYAQWASSGQAPNPSAPPGLAPATQGQVMAVSVWIKTSGLGVAAQLQLQAADCDISGSQLRTTTIQTLTGNQGAWTQMTGTWTPGASTVLAEIFVTCQDSTAGSANGTIWLDNAQLWNQTRTGQSSMPYCELRFPSAPAQLVVSGLIGDIAAPAYVACGVWFGAGFGLPSLAAGGSATFGIGRRATPSASAQLVGNLQVFNGLANAVLDSNSYGGYYLASASNATAIEYDPPTSTSSTSGTQNQTVNNLLGTWHVFERAQSSQATIANVTTRLNAGAPGPWVAYGSQIAPLVAASTWTMVDAGQVAFPAGGLGAIAPNPSTLNVNASTQWADSTGGGSTMSANWFAYLPVDTNLLYGTILNPSNAGGAIANTWFFTYVDALGPFSQVGVPTRQSQETTALDAPFAATGGPGTTTSTYPSVNPVADPYLTVDPTTNANTNGVNQLVVVATDNVGTVLPVALEIRYAPEYLYPK